MASRVGAPKCVAVWAGGHAVASSRAASVNSALLLINANPTVQSIVHVFSAKTGGDSMTTGWRVSSALLLINANTTVQSIVGEKEDYER